MSVISLLGVNILNNPAKFGDKYQFEITFECLESLQKEDLEWKLTYVGSATSDEHDQELDSLLVGPVPTGINKFTFEASAPDTKRIPDAEILGVTVILLTCSYDGREFVRVGYYVNNEYESEEMNADPPAKPVLEKVRRNILAEKPRVTRFNIKWDSDASAPAEFPPDQPEADLVADEEEYGAEEAAVEAEDEEENGEEAPEGDAMVQDSEMAGAEMTAVTEEATAGDESEDLEAESSGSEDELLEEEEEVEGEGEAGDAMEMDEGPAENGKAATNGGGAAEHHADEVMAH